MAQRAPGQKQLDEIFLTIGGPNNGKVGGPSALSTLPQPDVMPPGLRLPSADFTSEDVDTPQAALDADFTSEDVDTPLEALEADQPDPKTFMKQIGDLFGRGTQQIDFATPLLQANTELATVIQTVMPRWMGGWGKPKEGTARFVDDLKTVGLALATAAGLPTPAHDAIWSRGEEAFRKGKYSEAAGHFAGWIVPLVGPSISEATSEAAAGNWGAAAGIILGQGVNAVTPMKMNRMVTASAVPSLTDVAGQAVRPMAANLVPDFIPPTAGAPLGVPTGAPVVSPALAESALSRARARLGVPPANSSPVTAETMGATLRQPMPGARPITHAEQLAFAQREGIPVPGSAVADSENLRSLEQLNASGGLTAFGAERVQKNRAATQATAAEAAGQRIADRLYPERQEPHTAGAAAQSAKETITAGALEQQGQVTGAYQRAGESIMGRLSPDAVDHYAAGTRLSEELNDVVSGLTAVANDHYDAYRTGVASVTKDVEVGRKASVVLGPDGAPIQTSVVRSMEYPLDISDAQADLRSMFEALSPQSVSAQGSAEVRQIALQQYGPAYAQLERLVHSGSVVPWEELEEALGALKSIQRATKGRANGLVGSVITRLERVIRVKVRETGGNAILSELEAGRAATKQKYEVMRIVDQLNKEPSKAARQLMGDNENLLRDVMQAAPKSRGALARAHLNSILQPLLRKEGALTLGDVRSAATKWANTSKTVRESMYPERVLDQLDRYFKEMGRAAERDLAIPALSKSPEAAYNALVAPTGVSSNLIEWLAKVDPGLPLQLGRARFDQWMKRLFVEGDRIDAAKGVLREYRAQNSRMRRLLYGPADREIGTFFQTLADEAFMANPSRSGYVVSMMTEGGIWTGLSVANPLSLLAAPPALIARTVIQQALWSPRMAKAINAAMRVSKSAKGPATVAAARVFNEAKREGIPMTNVVKGNFGAGMPQAAEQQQEQPPTAGAAPGTQVGRFMVTESPDGP